MSIVSLNVNSLPGHFDEIQLLLKNLGIHVLAFNETKLDPEYPKELTTISGYQQESRDRNGKGRGVSIYIRDAINYTRRNDLPDNQLELICIEIEPPKSRSFFIVARYRPPSEPVDIFAKLQQILSFLDREDKEIILLGDTNCDLFNHALGQSVENNTRYLCDIYELFSLEQLINEPTRVTPSSTTIIDHIATTSANNIAQAGVFETSLSDHFMVFCVRKFDGAQMKDHKVIKTHSMKKFNGEAFLTDVASICWEQIVRKSNNLDSLVQEWTNIFYYIVKKHAPLRSIRISEKYCPWINSDLKAMIRSRCKIKKAAVKSGSPLLLASYRHVRNKVNRLNINLKREYFTTKNQSSQGDMKETWENLKSVDE